MFLPQTNESMAHRHSVGMKQQYVDSGRLMLGARCHKESRLGCYSPTNEQVSFQPYR